MCELVDRTQRAVGCKALEGRTPGGLQGVCSGNMDGGATKRDIDARRRIGKKLV